MNSIFCKENENLISSFKSDILKSLNSEFVKKIKYDNSITPRIVGDLAEGFIKKIFSNSLPKDIGTFINEELGRRAMADFAFNDIYNNYIVVDVKAHNKNTKFNMPNITSVERLSKFYYKNDNNIFSLLMVSYDKNTNKFSDIYFIPIEYLDWSCLNIGALGWGQIQIANYNNKIINKNQTKKEWMLNMIKSLKEFYPKEIDKIHERLKYFESIEKYWRSK
ncbi:hypothetical protein [Brachyspira sp.]|uniref:hypothetical protein n=1 Tax=Brachyspira sp. TaxID=1977261 RepID=UPI003D7CAF4F